MGEHVRCAVQLLSGLRQRLLAGKDATANLAGQEVVRLSQTILCHLSVSTILAGELAPLLDEIVLRVRSGAQEGQFKSIVLVGLLGVRAQQVGAGLGLARGQCLHTIV